MRYAALQVQDDWQDVQWTEGCNNGPAKGFDIQWEKLKEWRGRHLWEGAKPQQQQDTPPAPLSLSALPHRPSAVELWPSTKQYQDESEPKGGERGLQAIRVSCCPSLLWLPLLIPASHLTAGAWHLWPPWATRACTIDCSGISGMNSC